MRHMLAMALALGISVATAVPAAFAGGEEGGHDLSFPATTVVQAEPDNLGTVAGPEAPGNTAPIQIVNEHETDRN